MTMKRDGSFVVELHTPLKGTGADVEQIVIRPPAFDAVIRWGRQEIPSSMALLAELTGLPERLLRLLTYPDVDRVMFAFMYMMPPSIATDFQQGTRPLASPDEDLPGQADAPVNDQLDPRFPAVSGPVRRFPSPPVVNIPKDDPKDDGAGFDVSPPETVKAVNQS